MNESVGGKVEVFDLRSARQVKWSALHQPRTPPSWARASTPPIRGAALSRVLLGRVLEEAGLGTPVKLWQRDFWSARRRLYEESDKPPTPLKISPPEDN